MGRFLQKKITCFVDSGFPTGVENMGGLPPALWGGGGSSKFDGGGLSQHIISFSGPFENSKGSTSFMKTTNYVI